MLERLSIVKGILNGFIQPLGFFFTQALALITSHHKRSSMLAASPSQLEHKKGTTMIATAEPIDLDTPLAASRPKVVRHTWHETKQDEYTLLEHQFARWLEGIAVAERAFKEHVYDNKELTDFDLRQHRQILYYSLWAGEKLAVDLLALDQPNKIGATQKYVILIDEKLTELRETLHSWHGAIEHQADIPQSFKDAIQELNRGELEPMDDMFAEQQA